MKLLLVILLWFFIYIQLLESVQNQYEILPERCDADVGSDKTVISNVTSKCYKASRKEMYLNLSFVSNVNVNSDEDMQILVTGYQFRSNEYRVGPIRFSMGLCTAAERKDLDIPNMLALSNIKCPIIKKHFYYLYKLSPNATNFPPLIPEGRWKIELVFKYKNKSQFLVVSWYIAIVYPIKYIPLL